MDIEGRLETAAKGAWEHVRKEKLAKAWHNRSYKQINKQMKGGTYRKAEAIAARGAGTKARTISVRPHLQPDMSAPLVTRRAMA